MKEVKQHRVSLSEAEARGIADVLRLCDEIVRDNQCGDDTPAVFDPEQVQDLLDEMDGYRDLLANLLDDARVN
jgi:hypothetical protein